MNGLNPPPSPPSTPLAEWYGSRLSAHRGGSGGLNPTTFQEYPVLSIPGGRGDVAVFVRGTATNPTAIAGAGGLVRIYATTSGGIRSEIGRGRIQRDGICARTRYPVACDQIDVTFQAEQLVAHAANLRLDFDVEAWGVEGVGAAGADLITATTRILAATSSTVTNLSTDLVEAKFANVDANPVCVYLIDGSVFVNGGSSTLCAPLWVPAGQTASFQPARPLRFDDGLSFICAPAAGTYAFPVAGGTSRVHADFTYA